MKRQLLLLAVILSLLFSNSFAQTVYITKTGKKYHTATCRYLSKSSFSIELSDAIAKGYEACSVCKPTSTVTSKSPKTQTVKQVQQNNTTQTNRRAQYVQCSAITKKGTRCSRMTKSPNGKCWQHGGD